MKQGQVKIEICDDTLQLKLGRKSYAVALKRSLLNDKRKAKIHMSFQLRELANILFEDYKES